MLSVTSLQPTTPLVVRSVIPSPVLTFHSQKSSSCPMTLLLSRMMKMRLSPRKNLCLQVQPSLTHCLIRALTRQTKNSQELKPIPSRFDKFVCFSKLCIDILLCRSPTSTLSVIMAPIWQRVLLSTAQLSRSQLPKDKYSPKRTRRRQLKAMLVLSLMCPNVSRRQLRWRPLVQQTTQV